MVEDDSVFSFYVPLHLHVVASVTTGGISMSTQLAHMIDYHPLTAYSLPDVPFCTLAD